MFLRLGDGRSDLGEGVVLLLGDVGVQRENQVRFESRDLLEVELAALADDLRNRPRPQLLAPRPVAVGALPEPVDDAHRLHAEREQRLGVGQADRDDPGGLGGDLGRAVLVSDCDRKRTLAALDGRRLGTRRVRLVAAAGGESQCDRHEDNDAL